MMVGRFFRSANRTVVILVFLFMESSLPTTMDHLRRTWQKTLFPEPARTVRGERWWRILIRTIHIASMAVLVGSHYVQADTPLANVLTVFEHAASWRSGDGA